MDIKEQINILNKKIEIEPFEERLKTENKLPLKANKIEILQLNITRKCNMACKHCHVDASPMRTEMMNRDILTKCLYIAKEAHINTIDITGGAPEMNPDLEWFLDQLATLNKRIIVRSNLTILSKEEYKHFIDVFLRNKVEIVTSLPDYHPDKTDRQRGSNVFEKVIKVMKDLNKLGYGSNTELKLHIVHNPVGAYLPGSQQALESEYKKQLIENYGITFDSLFSLTNCPIGKYLEYLLKSDNFDDYMNELYNAFNPCAVDNVMCKNTLSVSWDGKLYDCDFNQMLDIQTNHGAPDHISNFNLKKIENRRIMINNHCYSCTAGAGSSCQGSTA